MTATLAAAPGGNTIVWRGALYGAGAGALWGLAFLAPELVRDFAPVQLATGRFLAYGALSAVMIAPRWRRIAAGLGSRDWLALALLALVGHTLYYVLTTSAVLMAGIAATSLIIGFLPVAVTIIGSRDRGAVPLRRLAPSLLLCSAGIACVGWQALAKPMAGGVEQQAIGLLCALGALASWTAFAVGNSRCLARLKQVSDHDWNLLTGCMAGAQALVLIPLSAAIAPQVHAPGDWMRLVLVAIGVAVTASILGNVLWNRMSRLLPLTLVGQMILFETLFALLYGLAWEQRLPTVLELAASGLVVSSVLSCIAAHRRHRQDGGAAMLAGEQPV